MTRTERTTCLVVGGGPAGMVLGLLLARAGIAVTVLEKHADFLRDFRGDTVHPTTLDLLDDLGLGEEFAKLPQSRLEGAALPTPQGIVPFGDFTQLSGKHNYIAMVPQWDLLDLLADSAKQESEFTLRMETEAIDLVRDHGRVTGVEYRTAAGETGQILADLTIAADGRRSVLRSAADLNVRDYPTPLDVWWFRLPRHTDDPSGAVGVMSKQRVVIMLDRNDYWQTAVLIRKGSDPEQRKEPVSAMLASIAEVAPWLADRVDAVTSWDDVKLLDVRVDRLSRWYSEGLLCIGDAAHAMSPVGGVGINLAVQDAVAAARILAPALQVDGPVPLSVLRRVQLRRWWPTALIQAGQRVAHRRILGPVLKGGPAAKDRPGPVGGSARPVGLNDVVEEAPTASLPLPLRLMRRFPVLQGIPGRVIAIGPLPEHAPAWARRPEMPVVPAPAPGVRAAP